MRAIGLNMRATEIRNRQNPHAPSRASATARASKAGSLLRKAIAFRVKPSSLQSGHESEGDSGINAAERREIEAEIEVIAGRTQISVGAEAFEIKPRRKGFLFPLVVNIVVIALTVGSVYGLAWFFGQKDEAQVSSAIAVDSAEGLLLQELKRDSESKLLEKDKAISDIRDRLGSLDKERSQLAGTIDARVRQKEAQLKAALQAELDAEKKRLGAQGLSQAAADARLKSFEAARTAESTKQLEAERVTASTELAAAEDNYRKLKEDYQKSISSLGEERGRIQDEARKREDELRSSMDAKNKELESRNAATEASLAKAKAELASLSDRKAKTQAAEDRILGLYGTIRSALREGRYADAASGSASLIAYLDDPSLASDPAAKDRRAADLFVAQTLGAYARSELERTSTDATQLLRQAELLSAAREASSAASKALKSGDAALASAKYGEALEKVPEILAAHEYFLAREREAETARRSRLSDSLSAAERAFKARDMTTASARYAEALSYLPLEAAEREALLSRLSALGAADAEASSSASDTRSARAPFASAARAASEAKWAEAIGGYLSLLAASPRAEQAQAALAGIESARAGMQKAFDEKIAASDAAARKNAEALASLSSELSTSKTSLAGASARIADLEKRLKDAMDSTSRSAANANAALASVSSKVASDTSEIESLRAEVQRLKEESARLNASIAGDKSAADKYRALTASYASFLEHEASGTKDGGASIAANSSLYTFLNTDAVAGALPGLKEKVSGYQAIKGSESLVAFSSDAAEIVRQAAIYKDTRARSAYYASRREAYSASGDELMVSFIDALSKTMN